MVTNSASAKSRYVDHEVVQRILKFLDFIGLSIAAILLFIRFGQSDTLNSGAVIAGFVGIELSLLCILGLRHFGLYELRALATGIPATLKAIAVTFLTGAVVFAGTRLLFLHVDAQWVPWWFAFVSFYFILTRQPLAQWAIPIARQGGFRKRVAIVGGGKAAELAIDTLASSRDIDIDIVGLFDDRDDMRSPASIQRYRKIGKISDLADFARATRVDLIIVAIPISAEARLLHILKRLWELPLDIRISGQASSLRFGPRAYSYLGNLPLLAVFDRPLNGWNMFVKSTLDRAIALAAIVALSPVMLATALAVKLESKGPIIFRQKRYGFNNELIEVFKFRSMYTDMSDATASKLVTKGDPRVTKVGRIIRKTSLDELPQLFNVLTGQLSLVGPRPHATQAKAANALYEKVVEGYFARHKVKPGITGWAQINGWRGETDTAEKIEQRVKYDLEYIDHWSLLFDLKILFKTPLALLKSEHAY